MRRGGGSQAFCQARRAIRVGATSDNRLFVNAVLWVLRSGAHWHDLPERYGKYKTIHKRFADGRIKASGSAFSASDR